MTRQPFSYRADPDVPPFADDRPIFVFDGVCLLCSSATRFILEHDRQRKFRFVVAQSPLGAALYRHYGLKSQDYESNIILENGFARTKSDGSIRLFELVGFPWSLARALRVVPVPLRDRLYELVARNRLRWFGTRETCYLPDPGDRERFLDGAPP